MTMTTNTIPDHLPPDPATRTALVVLAMFFDERHANRLKLAEQMRADEDPSYPEQQAIADTMQNAANVTWEMCGGRPDGSFAHREHFVKISARELASLIVRAERPLKAVEPESFRPGDFRIDKAPHESFAVLTMVVQARVTPGVGSIDTFRALLPKCELLIQRELAGTTGSPANECSNAERQQYETTIEQQKARIAELLLLNSQSCDRADGAAQRREQHISNIEKAFDVLHGVLGIAPKTLITWNCATQ
jgi:hypothetical protein